METFSLKELAVPMMKSLDNYNYLLKSHHRRVAVISYYLGEALNLNSDELFSLVVAAGLHDVGALTARDRQGLIQEEVSDPMAHCIIGAEILGGCSIFQTTAKIIRHHHDPYIETKDNDDILLASHIIHLADRIEILIPDDVSIVNPRAMLLKKLRSHIGIAFHPDVFDVFERISEKDAFWSDVQYTDFVPLFEKLEKAKTYTFTLDETLELAETWSRVIDFRSQYTITHSYTVAYVADLLGGYLGFSEDKRTKVMLAGFIHDIGKLAIDPRIVEKRGTLTIFEKNQMKRHVYYTERILYPLSKIEWFKESITWAERHHERVDGSGYPFSLTEKSLDDGAKVLIFADIICAHMEKRAHRNALSIDAIFNRLKKEYAKTISEDIYRKIEPYKLEIYELIASCHEIMRGEYNDIMEKVSKESSGYDTPATDDN